MLSNKQFRSEVRAFVDLIEFVFDEHYENINQLAKAAGLSHATVSRLLAGKTKRPAYSTVLKLGAAVGLSMLIHRNGKIQLRIFK